MPPKGICEKCQTEQHIGYSIDYSGYICDSCHQEMLLSFFRTQRQPVLTWGGWR